MTVEAPAFLQMSALNDADDQARLLMISQLRHAQEANRRQEAYYEGSKVVRDLGIAIPPHLTDLEAVAGWPEIVVDVMDEKSTWRGWYSPATDLGLKKIYRDNCLQVESSQAVLDALIFGLSYFTVGTGQDDEPELLVKAESPMHMTGIWDPRKRRLSSAMRELRDDRGRLTGWKLYLPGRTITTERVTGRLVVTDVDEHGKLRIPVSVLLNRPRASRTSGRSEITRAVRSITDSGMRTLLGMEISREFYASVQRYLMGADEKMFVDENGNPVSQWKAILGRLLIAPRDEDGNVPTAGQFQSASPQPFTELLKTYSQMLSAATGISATHLGFTTDNPASSDAIERADMRLNNRAIRRHGQYDLGLLDLAETCLLWRDGELPAPGSIQSQWVDPSAPSPAARADRAVKMISVGALDPTWDVTLEQFGLTDQEIVRVKAARGRAPVATAGPTAPPSAPTPSPSAQRATQPPAATPLATPEPTPPTA